jgi:hypothetical protein
MVWLVYAAVGRCQAAEDPATQAVVDWNVIAVRTMQTGEPLLGASRGVAMAQVAVFDALNAIKPRYKSYFLKGSSQPEASPISTISAAAHATLVALYPAQQETLDRELADTLAAVPAGRPRDAGVALGRQAAQAVLQARANDHMFDQVDYTPATDAGAWQPTSGDGIAPWLDPRGPDFVPAIGPGWGRVTPFVLERGSQFRPGPPPNLSSETYAQDFAEIVELGSAKSATRTSEQTETALLWWSTGTVLWNQPAQQLVISQGFDALRAAHAFALLNVMIVDAAIACWDAKYTYNQWRPITGIRNADIDGNPATAPDLAWTPLMWTPPFPDYPSGHSVVGAAAARALIHSFGPRPGGFTLTGAGGRVHRYEDFEQAVQEVIDARVWGGAHWRSSDTLGVELGNRIADYVLSRRGS